MDAVRIGPRGVASGPCREGAPPGRSARRRSRFEAYAARGRASPHRRRDGRGRRWRPEAADGVRVRVSSPTRPSTRVARVRRVQGSGAATTRRGRSPRGRRRASRFARREASISPSSAPAEHRPLSLIVALDAFGGRPGVRRRAHGFGDDGARVRSSARRARRPAWPTSLLDRLRAAHVVDVLSRLRDEEPSARSGGAPEPPFACARAAPSRCPARLWLASCCCCTRPRRRTWGPRRRCCQWVRQGAGPLVAGSPSVVRRAWRRVGGERRRPGGSEAVAWPRGRGERASRAASRLWPPDGDVLLPRAVWGGASPRTIAEIEEFGRVRAVGAPRGSAKPFGAGLRKGGAVTFRGYRPRGPDAPRRRALEALRPADRTHSVGSRRQAVEDDLVRCCTRRSAPQR